MKKTALKKYSGSKNGLKIYSNSENSIDWVIKNFPDSNISDAIKVFKNKYEFRKLISSIYPDFFFCESAAAGALPGLLKSQFFSRNRQPMIVHLEQDPEQIAKEIRDATECAELYVKSDTRCFLRCGAFNVSFDQLAENIVHGIEEAMKLIPKAKARVESIALMTSGIEMQPFWRKHGKIVKVTPEMVKVEKNEEGDE